MKILNMIRKAECKNDNNVNQVFIDFCYLCITLNKHYQEIIPTYNFFVQHVKLLMIIQDRFLTIKLSVKVF